MPRVKRLNLGLDAQIGHRLPHRPQHTRRVGHHVIRFGKVHRAAVEGTNLRKALGNMHNPLGRTHHVGARNHRQRRLNTAEHNVSPHTGG